MLTPDESTTETERRLERIEHEMRRRQSDSAMILRGRDSVGGPALTPPTGSRLYRDAGDPAAPKDDRALIDLLADRLNQLEKKSGRLEREVQRYRHDGRRWRRIALGSVVGALLAVGVAVWVVGSRAGLGAEPAGSSHALP